jgi:hypothetical protein
MASEERKAADKKIEEENFFLSLGAAEQQAETDAFQCGRCKQVRLKYFCTTSFLIFHLEEMSLSPGADS